MYLRYFTLNLPVVLPSKGKYVILVNKWHFFTFTTLPLTFVSFSIHHFTTVICIRDAIVPSKRTHALFDAASSSCHSGASFNGQWDDRVKFTRGTCLVSLSLFCILTDAQMSLEVSFTRERETGIVKWIYAFFLSLFSSPTSILHFSIVDHYHCTICVGESLCTLLFMCFSVSLSPSAQHPDWGE